MVSQALLQQVTEYIAQYTPKPRIISYLPNANGDVMGRFESQGRVFSFRLSSKGLVYKPVVPRKDGESDEQYALRFDTGSEILLDRLDAAKAYKPKPSITIGGAKKQRGTRENPKCGVTSYQCGVCISLGKNCIKNANTEALKERLSKINSLARMAAKGEAVPQVKTGVIGAKNDPKSLKKKAQAQARELAKGGKTSTNPKINFPQLSEKEIANGVSKKQEVEYQAALLDRKIDRTTYDKLVGNNYPDVIELHGRKTKAKRIGDFAVHQQYAGASDANGESIGSSRKTMLTHVGTGKWILSSDDMGKDSTAISTKKKRLEIVANEIKKLIPNLDLDKLTPDQGKLIKSLADKAAKGDYDKTQPKQSTRDRQAAARAAAEPNKTTTLATPLPLTAQSLKRMERGESISDYDTYSVKKEGDKFRITDPNKFEDTGKLVDKAGLAAHMKELEAQPKEVKKSSSMNPAIPITKDPDTMLRALRNGRLIGDAKQGYEIQAHPTEKGSYLMTTMPNKKGDYSGVMSRKELVDFVKSGGDASRFNKKKAKPESEAITSTAKPTIVKGKAYTTTSGNQFQRIEIDGKSYDIKTREGRNGSAIPYSEAKAEALAQHEKSKKVEPKPESSYIPLTSDKNLSNYRKNQQRSTDQIAIDRAKSDVGNATKRINAIDAKIKATTDPKKIAQLERQKADWVEQRNRHKAKLEGLSETELKNNPETPLEQFKKTEPLVLKDYPDLKSVKAPRKDSFNDSDRILTYITDPSGNMMGIVQLQGIKYRFLKPIFGSTVLTPISETGLSYLFDMAPDLSLPMCDQGDVRALVR